MLCNDTTKANIAAVFNCEHSEEFYRGVAAALHACGKLVTDQNYPTTAKPTVILAALGYVGTKIARGEWPK